MEDDRRKRWMESGKDIIFYLLRMTKIRTQLDHDTIIRVPALILKKVNLSAGDAIIIESDGENIIIRPEKAKTK